MASDGPIDRSKPTKLLDKLRPWALPTLVAVHAMALIGCIWAVIAAAASMRFAAGTAMAGAASGFAYLALGAGIFVVMCQTTLLAMAATLRDEAASECAHRVVRYGLVYLPGFTLGLAALLSSLSDRADVPAVFFGSGVFGLMLFSTAWAAFSGAAALLRGAGWRWRSAVGAPVVPFRLTIRRIIVTTVVCAVLFTVLRGLDHWRPQSAEGSLARWLVVLALIVGLAWGIAFAGVGATHRSTAGALFSASLIVMLSSYAGLLLTLATLNTVADGEIRPGSDASAGAAVAGWYALVMLGSIFAIKLAGWRLERIEPQRAA